MLRSPPLPSSSISVPAFWIIPGGSMNTSLAPTAPTSESPSAAATRALSHPGRTRVSLFRRTTYLPSMFEAEVVAAGESEVDAGLDDLDPVIVLAHMTCRAVSGGVVHHQDLVPPLDLLRPKRLQASIQEAQAVEVENHDRGDRRPLGRCGSHSKPESNGLPFAGPSNRY